MLSPDECQQKLAVLKRNSQPPDPNQAPATRNNSVEHWSEPHGRYIIAIVPGWHVDDSKGNLKVTKGASWAIFDTESKDGAALDVAQANAKQMSGMVSRWQILQQQPFKTPRHHSSGGVTVQANVPTRAGQEQRVMTFAAQAAGSRNFVTLTASSLTKDAPGDQGQVMAMFNSVRFTNEQ